MSSKAAAVSKLSQKFGKRLGHYAKSSTAIGAGLALVAATLWLLPPEGFTAPYPQPSAPTLEGVAPDVTMADLQRRIAAQDRILAMTETMKHQLRAPTPIWATGRDGLPYNHAAIEEHRQHIAILEHDLATARRVREALVAAVLRAEEASSRTRQEAP